jgi:hypothetical protein
MKGNLREGTLHEEYFTWRVLYMKSNTHFYHISLSSWKEKYVKKVVKNNTDFILNNVVSSKIVPFINNVEKYYRSVHVHSILDA